jgi:hypothetical protein
MVITTFSGSLALDFLLRVRLFELLLCSVLHTELWIVYVFEVVVSILVYFAYCSHVLF